MKHKARLKNTTRLTTLPADRWIYPGDYPASRDTTPRLDQYDLSRGNWPTLAMIQDYKRKRVESAKMLAGRVAMLLLALAVVAGWLYVSTDQYHDERKAERTERWQGRR